MRTTLSTTDMYRIHYKEKSAIWKLSSLFLQHIPFDTQNLLFYCIGTDRSTGDSLGPLTGSLLSESLLFPFPIIGTLENPLHALNLQQQIDQSQLDSPAAFIVAIDACLGQGSSVGQVLIHDGPIYPGKAVGKDLPPVGDLSIKGVVNIAGFMEHAVLQSTRLHLSYEMSRMISRALLLAYTRHKSHKVINYNNHNANHNDARNQISHSNLSQTNQI